MHNVKVEHFEGPLDLLLQLIEQEKLDITTVSLATVTDQYIDIVNQSAQDHRVHLEELADFLVIAARLLLLKSKALLPFLQWGEEDDSEDLTAQLKMYKEYLDAAKRLQTMIAQGSFSFARQKLLAEREVEFNPPPKLTSSKLRDALLEVIRGLQPVLNLPTDTIRRTVNIQEKITSIREHIYRNATSNFSEILRQAKDKTEVIVTFLALLELVKQQTVFIQQDNVFDDIIISKAS